MSTIGGLGLLVSSRSGRRWPCHMTPGPAGAGVASWVISTLSRGVPHNTLEEARGHNQNWKWSEVWLTVLSGPPPLG